MRITRITSRPLCRTAAVLATAASVVALPALARAQRPLDPVQAVPVTALATRADSLDARAAAYEQASSVRRWREAARLRERAAGLRAPDDPAGFTSLARAAALRHGIGQPLAAGDLMERAGDQAIARGDVVNASWAYMNAGFVAAELRDPARAREFFTKGMLLMRSPLLSTPQREWLQGHVAPAASRLGAEVAAARGL